MTLGRAPDAAPSPPTEGSGIGPPIWLGWNCVLGPGLEVASLMAGVYSPRGRRHGGLGLRHQRLDPQAGVQRMVGMARGATQLGLPGQQRRHAPGLRQPGRREELARLAVATAQQVMAQTLQRIDDPRRRPVRQGRHLAARHPLGQGLPGGIGQAGLKPGQGLLRPPAGRCQQPGRVLDPLGRQPCQCGIGCR
mmetsp:Transcript_5254/g.19674  ORF Transcript_5254/g.19674 Transcript_5254/m.19674 type:complete len:193 (+) Transcript_5254:1196-1774(+)